MTEQRYSIDNKDIVENNGYIELNRWTFADKKDWNGICNELNKQFSIIVDLKTTLNEYRKVMSCANCTHHNYDWFDDGEEFEVCDKGNNEGLDNHFCKEWEEL